MDLTGIISISGKPGLYKVLTQTTNSVIVQSLVDKRKFPAHASDKISSLEDISIYTAEEDVPLSEVLDKIFDKETGKACINHKSDPAELKAYLSEILPDYDEDRVYTSDMKKLFQWYNLLLTAGLLKKEEAKKEKSTDEEKAAKPAAKKSAKPDAGKGAKPVNKMAPKPVGKQTTKSMNIKATKKGA